MGKEIQQILKQFLLIENLYIKIMLTIIAISLVIIATELSNRNYYTTVDLIQGSIKVDGTVDVSGEVDTYEQNTIIGRKFNH